MKELHEAIWPLILLGLLAGVLFDIALWVIFHD